MKLRIKGNSIRLRLLRSEVDGFASDGKVSEVVGFGPNALTYSLIAARGVDDVCAKFEDHQIAILVPEHLAREWAGGDGVSIAAEQEIASGQKLSILVEKDFVCIDRPDDPDREDAYPNPNSQC